MPIGGPGGGPLQVTLTQQQLEQLSEELWRRCSLPLEQVGAVHSDSTGVGAAEPGAMVQMQQEQVRVDNNATGQGASS
jgi:hypothetical protein